MLCPPCPSFQCKCLLPILYFYLELCSLVFVFADNQLRIGDRNETMREFISKLFDNYDKTIPPSMYTGIVMKVLVSIFIHSISGVNERSMDYSVNMFLRQYWNDTRLSYLNSGYNKSLTLNSKKTELWVPDLYFINEKEGNFHIITTPNLLLRLKPTGEITFSQKITVKLSCPMNLKKFPMDEQNCELKMESYGFTTEELVFEWVHNRSKAVEFSDELELPEFEKPKSRTADCTMVYQTGAYSCLKATFTLKRKSGFYLIQTYIPSILIVILSWVSFWIDVQAVPARISLGLLTVLSMTTQSSGARGQLPRVSYIKAIDVWMSTCLVFVFGALIEYAIANVLARRHSTLERWEDLKTILDDDYKVVAPETSTVFPNGDAKNRHPENIPMSFMRSNNEESEALLHSGYSSNPPGLRHRGPPPSSEASEQRWNHANGGGSNEEVTHAEMIDRISRAAFPLSFALFNLGYWLYYIYIA